MTAHTASYQTETDEADQSRTAAKFFEIDFPNGSDASERLHMRRREMFGVEGGGRDRVLLK